MSARTGTVQPDAEISPGNTQRRSTSEPTARAAPSASLLTIVAARTSCLAYASGYALSCTRCAASVSGSFSQPGIVSSLA